MRRVTLTQYLIEQQRQYGKVSPELRLLIEVIARACKAISHAVSKGPLAGIGDSMGLDNVQGEAQKKEFEPFLGAVQKRLETWVKEVRLSGRLTKSPAVTSSRVVP